MIEKIKEKYEIILGFVTLVVSLSAFKDELQKVNLNLGYTSFTLADYFLYVVYGFCACLYFYIIEQITRDTKIGNWKIFDYIIKSAYFLFISILFTPIIIILNLLTYNIYIKTDLMQHLEGGRETIVSLLISILGLVISIVTSSKLYKEQEKRKQEEIEIQEIKELDNATKLHRDGYYSHSILESFRVLETHLYKLLTIKNIRVQRHRINEMISLAMKYNLIQQEDISAINDIRGMRNAAAHSDTNYNKEHAEFALEFVKKLLKRNSQK